MRMAEVSLAQATCKFIDECPTPFHLCAETGALLKAAGFTEIAEDGAWRPLLKPGGSYFYTRAGTTLVAFHVGAAFEAGADADDAARGLASAIVADARAAVAADARADDASDDDGDGGDSDEDSLPDPDLVVASEDDE